jgi:hypothetical protein
MRAAGAIAAVAILLGSAPRAAQPAKLAQLGGIDELKGWFTANRGHLKVILLLSPT